MTAYLNRCVAPLSPMARAQVDQENGLSLDLNPADDLTARLLQRAQARRIFRGGARPVITKEIQE